MLTLVAAVLAYDIALEICDLRSSMVEVEAPPLAARLSSLASLKERSCTREENDMIAVRMNRIYRDIFEGLVSMRGIIILCCPLSLLLPGGVYPRLSAAFKWTAIGQFRML